MTAPTRRRPAVDEYDVQLLSLVAAGKTAQQIATLTHRTRKGVHSHMSRLYRRMGVSNAPHAIAAAFALGILPAPERTAGPSR